MSQDSIQYFLFIEYHGKECEQPAGQTINTTHNNISTEIKGQQFYFLTLCKGVTQCYTALLCVSVQ